MRRTIASSMTVAALAMMCAPASPDLRPEPQPVSPEPIVKTSRQVRRAQERATQRAARKTTRRNRP